MTKRELWFWLSGIPGIGAMTARALLKEYGSLEELWKLKTEIVEESGLMNLRQKNAFLYSREKDAIKRRFDEMTRLRIEMVTCEEDIYPSRLKILYDAPIVIYYKGKLPDEDTPTISMVGARDCSGYGREVALHFAASFADAGIQVISGLARGIDGFSHQGALEANGRTFGVLGCGVDQCYPRQNLDLYLEMMEKGGVLSEMIPQTKPLPANFPMRNRIIAALGDAILVVEAREESGSLITVDQGLELGKDIYAIPGRIMDPLSAGCHHLIRNGAILAQSPADVLAGFEHYEQLTLPLSGGKLVLDSKEEKVYACLDLVPKNTQFIVNETDLTPQEVMECLDRLEFRGQVREASRGYYMKAGLF
ncbi:MAG: DNA-processing protein DprA [Lachnospiraceae bacterium]|nr:DNA-processing protein DprA [Lachnospiraceae bacterium]